MRCSHSFFQLSSHFSIGHFGQNLGIMATRRYPRRCSSWSSNSIHCSKGWKRFWNTIPATAAVTSVALPELTPSDCTDLKRVLSGTEWSLLLEVPYKPLSIPLGYPKQDVNVFHCLYLDFSLSSWLPSSSQNTPWQEKCFFSKVSRAGTAPLPCENHARKMRTFFTRRLEPRSPYGKCAEQDFLSLKQVFS